MLFAKTGNSEKRKCTPDCDTSKKGGGVKGGGGGSGEGGGGKECPGPGDWPKVPEGGVVGKVGGGGDGGGGDGGGGGTQFGQYCSDLPTYSLKDVSKHITAKDQIWVIFREGVYDITNYVKIHPGGDQILIAAGGYLEPFYNLYGNHLEDLTLAKLEKLRIGNLQKEDVFNTVLPNPYATDPKRHPDLKTLNLKPYNGQVVVDLVVDRFITPKEYFYVRNHLPVPQVDPDTYVLEVEVEGTDRTLTLTLDQIKEMPKVTVMSTLMCSGNRRSEQPNLHGVINWGPGGVGNACWSGVRLRDVLEMVGITEDEKKYKHVQFEGLDLDATSTPFGGSIPIYKATDKRGDVLICYEMNGQPLTPDHGYPVRILAPGTTGARSVKWLAKIIVSENESQSFYQQIDYKGFPPNSFWDTVDFSKSPAVQHLPVNSAICRPYVDRNVKVVDGCIHIKGWAYSGGGNKIVRVDVTCNGGKMWYVADLDQSEQVWPHHWTWTLWSIKLPVDPNATEVEIWSKAVDSNYNVQPETFENIFNFQGVLNNAYHRVKFQLKR